jgi:hypothetical protein
VGLPRVKPGDDRLDGHYRRQLRRPPRQPLIRHQRRDLQECGGGDVGAELLDALGVYKWRKGDRVEFGSNLVAELDTKFDLVARSPRPTVSPVAWPR